jgi:hypothetical protein
VDASSLSLRLQKMRTAFRPARLLADERRVLEWFDSLSDEDRRRHYDVAEVRAAVAIPATRLHVVLYRLGWKRRRDPTFGIFLYQGPFDRWRRQDAEDIEEIIRSSTS